MDAPLMAARLGKQKEPLKLSYENIATSFPLYSSEAGKGVNLAYVHCPQGSPIRLLSLIPRHILSID